MWDCLHNANGEKCSNCVDEHCTPEFKTCSGLTPPGNSAEALDFSRLLAAEPTGRYVGDKDVLGAHVHAVMTFNDADADAGTMDFVLSGVLPVNCPKEPFTMQEDMVLLTDIEEDSDCIKSTLEQHDTTLEYIEYDASSDELSVK